MAYWLDDKALLEIDTDWSRNVLKPGGTTPPPPAKSGAFDHASFLNTAPASEMDASA